MESRWTDYAGRNRELPGGPASFLVRFSGGEAGTLWSAHSETPRAFRRLEELISGLEEEMESAAGRQSGRPGGPSCEFSLRAPSGAFSIERPENRIHAGENRFRQSDSCRPAAVFLRKEGETVPALSRKMKGYR